jgi:curli biogenesis system outer membrane secretion channel CsgG
MNRVTAIVTCALIGMLALQTGCSRGPDPQSADAPKRIAVVPFSASGNAESGQYALLLSNFSNALATQFSAASDWQVVESERLDALETEQAFEAPPPPAAPPSASEPSTPGADADTEGSAASKIPSPQPVQSAAKWAAKFPSADYVLIGRINGFDVRPFDARTGGATLARRENRVQSRIEVRIVDVHTRAWVAARSVRIDERLTDDSAAETQINQAMSLAADQVVRAVLRAVAGEREPAQLVESNSEAPPEGTEPRIAIGRFFVAGSDPESRVGGTLMDQITQELLLNFHQYSGLRVVEDRSGNIKDLLTQQMLEDLSKGRDPGLPMGSLHGVDYLIFGSIGGHDVVDGRREVTQMFGATLVKDVPPQMLFDGTIYILDVSRGEYTVGGSLSLDVDLRGQTASRAMATAARSIASDMFVKTMLQIRPLSVVDVKTGDIVLNHTSAVGLAVGDRFTAMSRGTDRFDSGTQTWLRNVGGQRLGELEISSFDAGGWAHAHLVEGELPPVGALLVRGSASESAPSRKIRF